MSLDSSHKSNNNKQFNFHHLITETGNHNRSGKGQNSPRISLRDVIRITSGKAFSLFQPS
jgi:hypothetical protein